MTSRAIKRKVKKKNAKQSNSESIITTVSNSLSTNNVLNSGNSYNI
jgi:hypothetical protein